MDLQQNGIKQLENVYWYDKSVFHKQTSFVVEEIPVALVYNGISHVVMMVTPTDLELFAIGFSLSENIVQSLFEINDIEIIEKNKAFEINITISSRRFMELKSHRRSLAGRSGCGVCGAEQIKDIYQELPLLPFSQRVSIDDMLSHFDRFSTFQFIGNETRGTHAAAWFNQEDGIFVGCEDIGRHVALDKVLGLRAQQKWQNGALLISSRASYEMVKKSISCGVEILCVMSAPSSMAIEFAKQYRLTLVGFCRDQHATIFTYPQRIIEFK